MLYALVKQLRRRHRRPRLGAAARRFGLPAFLNAVLLLPLLVALRALGRDPRVMGDLRNDRFGDSLALAALAIVALSVIGLAAAAFL